MSTTFIDNLKMFNRKERYHLLKHATDKAFIISDRFKAELCNKLEITIPNDAYIAMDYHLDWIYASLFLLDNDMDIIHENNDKCISGSQEDIDLIIAFPENDSTILIMVEAKADTSWTNNQIESKKQRLKKIFGNNMQNNHRTVRPYFVLTSPHKPQHLSGDYPAWMQIDNVLPWIELPIQKENLKKTTRCDKSGKSDENGDYWKVK